MFYFLLPFLVVSLTFLVLGIISPSIIRKIINVKLSRYRIVLIFGLLTIGFFILTYFTSPELKSFLRINNKTTPAVESQSQSLIEVSPTKEETKTTPSPTPELTKPVYYNSNNNNNVPNGATARCNDGTYSFSQNHQGTCSYHNGVKDWLN